MQVDGTKSEKWYIKIKNLAFVAGLIDGGWYSRVMDDIDEYLTKLKIGSSGSILVSTLGLLLIDRRNG